MANNNNKIKLIHFQSLKERDFYDKKFVYTLSCTITYLCVLFVILSGVL